MMKIFSALILFILANNSIIAGYSYQKVSNKENEEEVSIAWTEEDYTFKNCYEEFEFDDFGFILDVIKGTINRETAKLFDFKHLSKSKLSESKISLNLWWFDLLKHRPSLLLANNFNCSPKTQAIHFFPLAMHRLESLKGLELSALYNVSDEQLKIIGEGIAEAKSLVSIKISSALYNKLDQNRWRILQPFLLESKTIKTLTFSGLELHKEDWEPLP